MDFEDRKYFTIVRKGEAETAWNSLVQRNSSNKRCRIDVGFSRALSKVHCCLHDSLHSALKLAYRVVRHCALGVEDHDTV
jgi:hypothetical protein